MNIFTVIGIIGISMTALVALISATMYSLSKAVTNTYAELDAEQSRYRPAVTLGHKISPDEDKVVQFQQARVEAAKKAATLPRGGNMNIGRAGKSTLRTASTNLKEDPVSSYKIALQQGWKGLGQFDQYQASATGAQATVVAAAPVQQVKRKLVAGTDYEVVEITAGMDPADKRRARIANAKAKSAAYKKLKESGQDMVAVPTQGAAPAAVAAPVQSPEAAAAAAGIEPPTLIEITEGMDPADVRKARIANAKAQSAYKKALKAAGIDPNAPAPAAAAPAPAAPPVPTAPSQADAAAAAGIAPPDLIEITDDMDPGDVRKARIANAKAQSAYKKALKAAGIDPSAASAPAAPPAPAAAPAPAPAPVAAAPTGNDAAAAAGVDKPDLIEITDGMDPSEVRQARIANAKAVSAYKKALKAAGIDPSTVEI